MPGLDDLQSHDRSLRHQMPDQMGQNQTLVNDASDNKVIPVGAGATVVVTDTVFPSTAHGLAGTQTGSDSRIAYDVSHTKSDEPLLNPSTLDAADASATFTSLMGAFSAQLSGLGLAFGHSKGTDTVAADTALPSFADLDIDGDLASLFGTPPQPATTPSVTPSDSSDTPPTPPLTTASPEAVSVTLTTPPPPPPGTALTADQTTQLTNLFSPNTTSANALATLTALVPDGTTLTDAQKAALTILANNLATKTATGSIDGLDSENPNTVAKALIALYGGTDATMIALLKGIAGNIAPLNADYNSAMQSSDIATVRAAADIKGSVLSSDQVTQISNIFSPYTSSERVTASLTALLPANTTLTSSQSAELATLAATIATQNHTGPIPGMDSDDPATVLAALKSLYSGTDPSMAPLLSGIASNIAALNAQYTTDITSGNTTITNAALFAKADLANSNFNPAEKVVAVGYITMLLKCLVAIAELRTMLTQLEGQYANAQNQAKMQQMQDMTKLALEKYTTSMTNIATNLQQTLDAIDAQREAEKSKALWSWLGPVITAVMAIVAVAIIVGTVGVGTAAGVALVVATVAMSSVEIADQCTGCLTTMCHDMHTDSPVLQSIIKAAFMLVLIVVTGGAAFAIASVGMAASIAAAAAEMTIEEAAEAAQAVAMAQVGLVIQAVFTSGVVTQAFLQLFSHEPCKMSESNAQIAAMIATIVMMIVCLMAMPSIAGKLAGPSASGLATVGQDAAGATATTADEAATSANTAAQNALANAATVEEAANAASKAADAAQAIATKAAEVARAANLAKEGEAGVVTVGDQAMLEAAKGGKLAAEAAEKAAEAAQAVAREAAATAKAAQAAMKTARDVAADTVKLAEGMGRLVEQASMAAESGTFVAAQQTAEIADEVVETANSVVAAATKQATETAAAATVAKAAAAAAPGNEALAAVAENAEDAAQAAQGTLAHAIDLQKGAVLAAGKANEAVNVGSIGGQVGKLKYVAGAMSTKAGAGETMTVETESKDPGLDAIVSRARANAITGAEQQVESRLMGVLKSMAQVFKDSATNPSTYIDLLNLIAGIEQGVASINQGKADLIQSDYLNLEAQQQLDLADFTAALDYLQTTLPNFDANTDQITGKDGDIQSIMNIVTDMIDLVQDAIQAASDTVVKSNLAVQGKAN